MTIIKRDTTRRDSMRGHYAGFITRYVAFLIDILLIAAVSFTLITVTRVTLSFFGLDQILAQLAARLGIGGERAAIGSALRWFLTLACSFLVFGVYSILSWLLVGKTVGKALMGLRVLGLDGARITVKQALTRSIGYYLSALALLLGFLWVLVDDRRQGWHDKLARTVVVYEWDARYEERYVTVIKEIRGARARRQAARERATREALEQNQTEQAGHG